MGCKCCLAGMTARCSSYTAGEEGGRWAWLPPGGHSSSRPVLLRTTHLQAEPALDGHRVLVAGGDDAEVGRLGAEALQAPAQQQAPQVGRQHGPLPHGEDARLGPGVLQAGHVARREDAAVAHTLQRALHSQEACLVCARAGPPQPPISTATLGQRLPGTDSGSDLDELAARAALERCNCATSTCSCGAGRPAPAGGANPAAGRSRPASLAQMPACSTDTRRRAPCPRCPAAGRPGAPRPRRRLRAARRLAPAHRSGWAGAGAGQPDRAARQLHPQSGTCRGTL